MIVSTKLRAGGETPPDYGHEVLPLDEREMIVTALKMALIPEINKAASASAERWFEAHPAPVPKQNGVATWVLVLSGFLILLGAQLVTMISLDSAIDSAESKAEALREQWEGHQRELGQSRSRDTDRRLGEIRQRQLLSAEDEQTILRILASQGFDDLTHK